MTKHRTVRRDPSRVVLPSVVVALGLGLAAEGRAQGDGPRDLATIITNRGRTYERVRVRQLDFEEIRYLQRGARSSDSLRGEDVREVRWENPPGAYATGLSQLRAALYERAVKSFTTARNQAEASSWVKAFGTYQLAEAHRLLGRDGSLEKAVAEYEKLLSNASGHYLAPAAIYGLGQAHVAAERYGQAKSTFARLDSGYGDLWSIKGKLGEGDSLLAQGDAGRARGAFELARGRATSYPELQRAAQVGIGKAYVMNERWDEAVRFFDNIISEPGVTPEVAAGAWIGKGDCRFEQATSGGSTDEVALKEALIAYETCVVRYAGVPAPYSKALYQSARIYGMLGIDAQAEHLAEELRSRFPKSRWAKRLEGSE